MRKRWLVGGIGVAAVAAIVAIMAARPGGPEAQAKDGKGKADVALEFSPQEVVVPQQAAMSVAIEFSGPLVAPQTAIVRAKAAGTLLALDAAEGSRVTAGQALGRLDLTELGARQAERQALLDAARAQLAQAERTHASNQRLADQQFISPNALETSRAALDSSRAQAQAAAAQLETLRASLRDAALVSPIAGIVAKRHVVPGEKLAPEQPIVTIVDIGRLELAGSVGTHEVPRLAAGMPVQVRVEGVAKPIAATLARIAPAAEAGSRSIGVTVSLVNPKETLRAGQYALAQVTLEDPQRRLTVPEAAVGNTAGQEHVWVIEQGVLARRAVTTGRRDGASGRVEVVSGLAPTAQVLAARFENLREGAKASVVASKSAPVASAAASQAIN